MKFEIFQPSDTLKPYIKQFVVSEMEDESEYKVLPSLGIVVGFQYKGSLAIIQESQASTLLSAGITGIVDSYKVFKNSPKIGTLLVFFTEIGLAHFTKHPANELFNLSIGLEYIFKKSLVDEIQDRLSSVQTDIQRVQIVEQFFITQLQHIQTDKLIVESVRMIYQSKGSIRVKELNERLNISASPFEKRFRKLVGISPKKFASIVRFNVVLNALGEAKSLSEICYENNFFDQAHFIKDFKQFTGETPDKMRH
ncbi:helix-turn-helix domain-containing protein [Flectobacillus sp. BAB-3569]|uniref:helix-turn-helix domain-containing protein n=1 Tax=Flectobacillus sp. BAB-3569 TaxID=1509483 RepID=UPI000BA354E8|nr:helix-turn-helix domain-containing protein [Flectobacillus sp. BAB-3569]PAC32419.1 AraC family transcriptional regulator [Flectobacillus sp. BAB-3569]